MWAGRMMRHQWLMRLEIQEPRKKCLCSLPVRLPGYYPPELWGQTCQWVWQSVQASTVLTSTSIGKQNVLMYGKNVRPKMYVQKIWPSVQASTDFTKIRKHVRCWCTGDQSCVWNMVSLCLGFKLGCIAGRYRCNSSSQSSSLLVGIRGTCNGLSLGDPDRLQWSRQVYIYVSVCVA